MPLTKIVDGKTVELSPAEEAAIRAEWSANDPAKRVEPPSEDAVWLKALAAKGIKLTPADLEAARAALTKGDA